MIQRIRILLSLPLAFAASAACAETFDINLSNKALRADFAGPLSAVFEDADGMFDLGLLIGDDDERDLRQLHIGVLITGDAGARQANVTAGLGGRFVLIDMDQVSGAAIALGGQFEARMPAFNRIGMLGYVYGAPDVSAFSDLEGTLEYAVALDYQVLRNASVYVGYRQVKLDVKDAGTATADNGVHGGLRLNF